MEALAEKYMRFLNKARTNAEVTSEIIKMASQRNFFKKRKNFKIESLDKTAFALVRQGRRPIQEGLRIIYSHTDSPCLQVKPVPVRLEWDFDLQPSHLGVELSVMPYGAPVHYHWFARDCELRGWITKNGRRRKIKADVYIPDVSTHVDNRDDEMIHEAFSWENIRVISGHEGESRLLESLKFDSRIDFSRSRLFIVPKSKPTRFESDYISGYGHDNRICTFAAADAFLSAKPVYTTMMIGFDKEEIGSEGDGGAKGNFFEQILGKAISKNLNIDLEDVTWGLVQRIIQNSYAISADTDVGSSAFEAERIENVDLKSTGKLGYGAFVCAMDGAYDANQLPTTYVDRILTSFDKNNIKFQIVGSPLDANNLEDGSHAIFMTNRGIPTINIGTVVSGLHSHSELAHAGDLYWTREAYRAFFEDKK